MQRRLRVRLVAPPEAQRQGEGDEANQQPARAAPVDERPAAAGECRRCGALGACLGDGAAAGRRWSLAAPAVLVALAAAAACPYIISAEQTGYALRRCCGGVILPTVLGRDLTTTPPRHRRPRLSIADRSLILGRAVGGAAFHRRAHCYPSWGMPLPCTQDDTRGS